MDDLVDVLVRYGYLVVFGWVFAEQIGLPIPAMPALLAAGAMAGTGRLSLVLVLVLAGIASLVSDVIWYWIGRLGGGRVLGFLCRISLEPDSCVRRTEETFSRRGARSLLIAKFVPGYSTAAPPLAGIVRMRFGRLGAVAACSRRPAGPRSAHQRHVGRSAGLRTRFPDTAHMRGDPRQSWRERRMEGG
jgi:membrane protein DedA with SNARE-associated domain